MEGIRISGAGGSFAVPAEDLRAYLDVRATVGEAYAVGRRGELPERLGERTRSVFGVDVPARIRYRPGTVRKVVEDLDRCTG